MKRSRLLTFFILFLLCISPVCAPVSGANEISVYINGAKLVTDVPPMIVNDRTLVPLRAIAEASGVSVDWEETSQKVTLTSSSQTVILYIGKDTAYTNGTQITLDVPPKIINDRTMVPLRFVGESLGFNVRWYEETSTVTLYSDINKENALLVYVLNVGQADSIFVRFPDGKTMLVDGGNPGDAEYIVNFLHKNNVEKLDFLVATHPHSDHIGGLPEIIQKFGSNKYFMPAVSHNTDVFEKTLLAIKNRNGKITTAKNGVVITQGIVDDNVFKAEIIAPCSDTYSELNDYSAVIMLSFGKKRVLLTGDAETVSENEIKSELYADVLKVGHHGSETATGDSFLKKVNPVFALISVGENNSYGLPDSSVLQKLDNAGCTVYRTDKDGIITVITDGSLLSVYAEKDEFSPTDNKDNVTETIVFRTKNGKKYHFAHCRSISGSTSVIEITLTEAKSENLSPCSICIPSEST